MTGEKNDDNLHSYSGLALAAVLFARSLNAQNPTLVQSTGFHCSSSYGSGTFAANSWSVGGSTPATSGNSGAGGASASRPQLTSFDLIKAFDECSSALFQAFATGTRVPTVTITNTGQAGQKSPVTIHLDSVEVTKYLLGDGGSSPVESISFLFDRITITNKANGSKFCWDTTMLKSC